jgi:hypothetical protein
MKKLPIDVSTFKIMIDEDYLYVDKTEQIYKAIVQEGRYFFLSRPRRFGKSLLLSTLKEIFLAQRELFRELWIYKSSYEWIEYPVIYLNFSDLSIETSQELKISLSWALEESAQEYEVDISSAPLLGTKLKSLVKSLALRNKVVILIDEYDYPLINNLHNLRIAEANRRVLRNFFSVIKSMDAYLRAIFITGVTKFSKTSIFSGLNNLNDLSLDPIASTLLGYTEEEITSNFSDYSNLMAEHEGTTRDKIEQEIQLWYNGYRFSREPSKVYNPFSVLYCLKKQDFENYWFESGTPSFLVELLSNKPESLENIENIELSSDSLGAFDVEDLPLITVLFQTGYLTIRDYDKAIKKYKLGYPNLEVRESFKKYLLAAFAKSDIPTVETVLSQLTQAIVNDTIELFCTTLQSLFAHIPYQLHIPQECYYHSLLQLLGSLLGMDIQSEVSTDKGRIDLVLTTKTHIYIFEFKLNAEPATALRQIEERRYYEKYLIDKKKITLVGVAFKPSKNKLTMGCETKKLYLQ